MLLFISGHLLVRLLLVCALLCAVVPMVGARPPSIGEAWANFGFTSCDLPCFAGITPGKTSFGRISRQLMQNVPVIDPRILDTGSSINFWARLPSQRFAGVLRYEKGLVGEMRLTVLLPAANVVTQLGMPDCILLNTSSAAESTTIIFWQRGDVSIGAVLPPDAHLVNLNTDIRALWLRAAVPGDCSRKEAVPWRGFAPLWRYSGG